MALRIKGPWLQSKREKVLMVVVWLVRRRRSVVTSWSVGQEPSVRRRAL